MKPKQTAVAVALMDKDHLSKLIGSIGRASAKLVGMIQDAAIQCVGQSIVHRNATPAMQLFEAINGTRRDALVAYFEKFGNLTWSKAEKKIIFVDMAKIPNGRELKWDEEYVKQVASTMWLSTKAEPQPKSIFDIDEEARKFIDRLHKAAKRGATLKNDTLLQRLEQTYQQWVGDQYLKRTTALPTAADVQETAQATGTDGKPASVEKLQQLQETFGGKVTPVK